MNKILAALRKKRGSKAGKLPSKRSMNLYVKVKDGNSWQVFVPLAVFLALIVLCIYRLGVVDRLNKLNELQQENSRLEAQLDTLNEQLSGYEELEQEYRRYTTGYLREEEQGLLSRAVIFAMLDECTEGIANITDISITGNQVGLNVNGMVSLEDIDIIQDRLKEMPNVDEIKLSNASGINTVDVKGYIIFTVKEDDSEANASGDDTASADEATGGLSVNTDELAARLKEYTDAAANARLAKEAESAAASVVSSAASAVTSAVSQSTGSSNAAAQSQTAAAASGSSGTSASASSGSSTGKGATTQNINGDEVVVLPEGVSIYGFDSLADGQAQLQGAGQ